MTDDLSPRARAILDAAERLAGGRTPAPTPPPVTPPVLPPAPATAAQLAALAEHVRITVETVRARLEELTRIVDDLTERVDHQARQPVAPPPPPTPPPTLVAAMPAPPPPRRIQEPTPPPLPTPSPDDAPRLLAIELAVAGATRADVDARLRERFGVSSTAELLDEVFGVGSSPGARLPWGGTEPV